jgi:hypothetical protein
MRSFSYVLFLAFSVAWSSDLYAQASLIPVLKQHHQLLHDWLKDAGRMKVDSDFADATSLDEVFNWHEIARRAFPENWVNLSSGWQRRYTRAIRQRIIKKTISSSAILRFYLTEKNMRWEEGAIKNDKVKAGLNIIRAGEIEKINLRLIVSGDTWKIYDIRTPRFRLIRDLLEGYDELIGNGFSNEYIEAMILEADAFYIDDFGANESGEYPKGWGWRKKDDRRMQSGQRLYSIQRENDNAYLAARASNSAIALVKPFSYNIREFPYFSWRWRAKEFPARQNGSDSPDHVAEVVVLFYQNWIGMPVTLHYVWDTYSSPCTTMRQSGFLKDTFYKVVRTESSSSGEWYTEIVNPSEDYKLIFGEDPPEQIIGIYLVAESSQSNVTSQVDYDHFTVKRYSSTTSCSK